MVKPLATSDCRGDRTGQYCALHTPQAFVVTEEEGLVPPDGASDGAAELILTQGSFLDSAMVLEPIAASSISLRKNSQTVP